MHDTPTVVVNGATIVDCESGINWVGSATLSVYDFTISAGSPDGKSIDGSTSVTGGTYVFERGVITEPLLAYHSPVISCSVGSWTFKNIIFKNLTRADYYMAANEGVSKFDVINSTFIGSGDDPDVACILNTDSNFKIKNTIFVNAGAEALSSATGTIDHNLFYNSGTARGTNTVTIDPNLSSSGKVQSSESSVAGTGIGPSSDADIPDDDIDGDERSGATCYIGADEYLSSGVVATGTSLLMVIN